MLFQFQIYYKCNCIVIVFVGVGEIADVQLSYLEGGLEESQLGETEDINAKQISRFENCYPNVVYTREIKIQNKV